MRKNNFVPENLAILSNPINLPVSQTSSFGTAGEDLSVFNGTATTGATGVFTLFVEGTVSVK